MEGLLSNALRTKEGEAYYFREVWPRVYACLFYCQLVEAFLLECGTLPTGDCLGLIRREE